MRQRVAAVLFAVAVLAVAPTVAGAAPLTGDPALIDLVPHPRVPLPSVPVHVAFNDDERCDPEWEDGCSWWQTDGDGTAYEVRVRRGIRSRSYRAETLMHEVGHHFSEVDLDRAGRRRFMRVLGLRGSWYRERHYVDRRGDEFYALPAEWFADGYAVCATWRRYHRLRVSVGSYGYMPTRREHRAVCKLIRSYG